MKGQKCYDPSLTLLRLPFDFSYVSQSYDGKITGNISPVLIVKQTVVFTYPGAVPTGEYDLHHAV